MAVSYFVDDEDQNKAEETQTPIEGVPIESAKASAIDLRPEILAEKLLVSKENEIETLKS